MITKWYEVTCDYCGSAINHYIGNKPDNKELHNDGIVIVGNKQFCNEECWDKYIHGSIKR